MLNTLTLSSTYFNRGIKSLKAGILVLISAIVALFLDAPYVSLAGTIIGIPLVIAGIVYWGKYKRADREADKFYQRKN